MNFIGLCRKYKLTDNKSSWTKYFVYFYVQIKVLILLSSETRSKIFVNVWQLKATTVCNASSRRFCFFITILSRRNLFVEVESRNSSSLGLIAGPVSLRKGGPIFFDSEDDRTFREGRTRILSPSPSSPTYYSHLVTLFTAAFTPSVLHGKICLSICLSSLSVYLAFSLRSG